MLQVCSLTVVTVDLARKTLKLKELDGPVSPVKDGKLQIRIWQHILKIIVE